MASGRISRIVLFGILICSSLYEFSATRDECSCYNDHGQPHIQTECGCSRPCIFQGDCCADYRSHGTNTTLPKPKCQRLEEQFAGGNLQCETDTCVTGIISQILFCERAYHPRIREIKISGNLFEVELRNPQNESAVPTLSYISETGCRAIDCSIAIIFNVYRIKELVVTPLVGHGSNQSCPTDARCFWTLVYYNHKEFLVDWAVDGIRESTIQHREEGFILKVTDFFISEDIQHEGDVATCLGNVNSFARLARYLQLIFGLLSLISLSGVAWLHWKFVKLQNLYGFSLLSLSGALAVTNIVPFLQELLFFAPVFLTPVIHYAWLAIFGWETVIIFHVYRCLGGTNVVHSFRFRDISLKNATVQYALFAWLVPIPFVLAGITCHLAEVDNFRYGSHWFEDHTISTYVFFIPSFCYVVVGLALFISTLTNIGKIRSQAEETGGTPVDLLSIALRLQLTLGVPWIGFIVLKFFPDPALLPVVVTVNSLQGFFILLAFSTTKRVKKLVKDNYSTYPTAVTM